MARTDKDIPFWLKAREYPEGYEPKHRDGCVNSLRVPGDYDCDLAESPPIDHPVNASYCWWLFLPDNKAAAHEVYSSMPAHGCVNPRCTRCKQKKALKRKTRRKLERELNQAVRELD